MEMMHLLLRYPEIITNLQFIKASTIPLELRPGILCHKEDKIQDGEYVTSPLDNYKQNLFRNGGMAKFY